ncbi:MAG: ferrochelatase, partial [Chloroflexota bacterium]
FINPMADGVREALEQWDEADRDKVHIIFTAHSIPTGMARNSAYEAQLKEACRIVAEDIIGREDYVLVYQSRSGPPQMPWLEPDICDYIEEVHNDKGVNDIIVVPIGFISDHMEVMYDLDTEAQELADELGMKMVRVPTVHTTKPFVRMVRDLIVERMTDNPERPALGKRPANHDICPIDCCLPGERPKRPAAASQSAN